MDPVTAFVLIVPVIFFSSIVFYALHRKGDVKAGARVGTSSFFIEVREKKQPTQSGRRTIKSA